LRVASFKPASNDPRVDSTNEDEDRSDGISAKMTAGFGGGQIAVTVDEDDIEEDSSVLRRGTTRAAEFLILEFLDEEGNTVYSYEEKIYGGEVIFTLTSELTRAGTYNMVVSLKDNAEVTSTQVIAEDTVEILPQTEVCGLKLIADKERIAKPNSGIFDNCSSKFPDNLVCQGTRISLITLDQFGNQIDKTENEEFTVSIVDEANVVNDTVLKFKVPRHEGFGIPIDTVNIYDNNCIQPIIGTDTKIRCMVLGNERNEIMKRGTTALVARADDPNISDSEPLAIKVVENSLLVEKVSTKSTQTAGYQFDAFIVRVGDERGKVYLQNNKTVDYASVKNQPTLDPGAIKIVSPAEEIDSFYRDGKDHITGIFNTATDGTDGTDYFISDKAGKYSQVRVSAWEIVPAEATQVKYLNSIGEEITEIPPGNEKPYKTTLYEEAFHMYDSYGNEITLDLGEMEAKSANGRVSYINSKNENQDYGRPGGTGKIDVVYKITCCKGKNKAFSGVDEIKFTFLMWPGLIKSKFVIVSDIPPNPEIVVAETDAAETDATETDAAETDATETDATETDATETDATETDATETDATETGTTITGTITPYIETISIPVNGEVALTLEKTNVDVMRMIMGGDGDSLVPEVYEMDWKDIQFSAKQCEDAGGTFDNGECQLNETQCLAANGSFIDSECQLNETQCLAADGIFIDDKCQLNEALDETQCQAADGIFIDSECQLNETQCLAADGIFSINDGGDDGDDDTLSLSFNNGDEGDGECQLNETQCQAANGIFRDDKCQKQEEFPLVDGKILDFGNGNRKLLIIKAGSREGRFTLTFYDTSNTKVEKSLTFAVTKKVTVIVPPDETPQPTTATDEAQCDAEGNYWDANNADDADDADDEECKALAVLNNSDGSGDSAVLASDGTIDDTITSKARFTGGAALDDGRFKSRASMQITAKGSKVLFVGSIKFDAEDVGEKVDIVITVSYSLDADGNIQWFSRTSDALSAWDMNPANLETFKVAHLIEEENLTLPLVIFEETLSKEDVVPGTLNVYIGYRLKDGSIKFGALPIIFQMF
jgi:hypothetical protein